MDQELSAPSRIEVKLTRTYPVMSNWQSEFRERMKSFGARGQRKDAGAVPVSIKVRVQSGCFHRDHSPQAFEVLDRHLATASRKGKAEEQELLEHESGPEVLAWVVVVTGLAKSVVELVTAVIKARSEGIKRGDKPSAPLELIVRRMDRDDEYREEIVLRIEHSEQVATSDIEKVLDSAIRRIDGA